MSLDECPAHMFVCCIKGGSKINGHVLWEGSWMEITEQSVVSFQLHNEYATSLPKIIVLQLDDSPRVMFTRSTKFREYHGHPHIALYQLPP